MSDLMLREINRLGIEQIKIGRAGNNPERLGLHDRARIKLIEARDLLHQADLTFPRCLSCGKTLASHRQRTCSDRCRMRLHRRRREQSLGNG